MMKELRRNTVLTEKEIRKIVAKAAADGYELTTADFRWDDKETILVTEYTNTKNYVKRFGFK